MCGEWTPYCLTNSGLGLSSGSWIDADQFRCYTTEGEGLFIKFETSGIVQLNDKMHTVINTKLVQKYKQQWMEEQMKAEDQDLVSVSDAIPYLWGAADDSNHIFTAIYFG
jgi:regulatory protein YycI of two-component signal transduction system YycFG